MMLVRQDQLLSSISLTWEQYFASFQPFWYRPRFLIRINLDFCEQIGILNSVLFPIQDPIKFFRTFLSHNSPASGCPYRFRSRGTTGSSRFDHDFGHLFRGVRIQKSGHSDFGILSSLGAPSDFTWVYRQVLRRLLVHLAMTSMTFAAVICEADEPRPVNTTTLPLYFWNCGSNSAVFWDDICPSMTQSGLCFCIFVLPEWPPFCS